MFSKPILKRLAVVASSALFSLSTLHSAHAAPGALATAPLFLSNIVEPNVFFTLDDSGSMDWGPMVQEGTAGLATAGGLPMIDDDDRAYYAPSLTRLYNDRGYLPPWGVTYPSAGVTVNGTPNALGTPDLPTALATLATEWDRSWVVRNFTGNRNYYNPATDYTPWPGTQSDGTPMYLAADPAAALKHPDDTGGESVDLTARYSFTSNFIPGPDVTITVTDYYIPTYFIWNDDELDGQIDQADIKTRVEIAAGTAEMNNFANWFQYYRSRMNTTKSIIGSTINNTDASRMGMRMFNTGHMEDVETMSDVAMKRNLLEELYELVTPAAGTPARRSLRDTGNYFDNTGGSAPILSAANGGECQQNFNILMSDGFWNGGPPGVGNTDSNGGTNSTIFDGDQSQSNDGGNYADGVSNTLADVSMRDYERDLRTDLQDLVPITAGVDEATHQHLVTYTVAFGLNGTLDPTVDDPLAAGFSWPTPVSNTNSTVDDMWHTAYNSRGQYLSAQNPAQLEASLNAAIADIAERTATAAAVSINSAKLTTESVVYLAEFNTNRWQGDLVARKIIVDPVTGASTGELEPGAKWRAADVLNARNVASDRRVIYTHDGNDGVEFEWASLSAAQKDDLKTSAAGGVDPDAVGTARLEYLHGSRLDEGSGNFFRERLSLLADLVNSGPVFVGAPDLNWPDTAPFPDSAGSRYSDFKNGPSATREGIVYVGSNGGMLHGFAEDSGEERIAYIANNLFSTATGEGLHYLTDQNYKHKYYNDLTPTVSDIYADLGSGNQWQTVLVAGQRGGQRGIYALNVNDPANFQDNPIDAAKTVLWEFTNADDPDLGFTYSRPQIGMTNDGRWVAIFGNGYNDTGDGQAKLFIVDIARGVDGSWTAGDYREITTGVGTIADRNGLATPALADIDGNGTIDRVYAGDLKGNLWAFDLSDSSPLAWNIAGGDALFTTIGAEPITAQPTLSKHPTVSSDGTNAPNIMVFFGSGQYLVNADKISTPDNYFYGVWDKGDQGLASGVLEQQFLSLINVLVDTDGDLIPDTLVPVRTSTSNTVNYLGGQYGWYMELNDGYERSITKPVVRGQTVFFNTFIPELDPCKQGGFGWRMAVDLISGGAPTEPTFDVNGDGVIDENDRGDNGEIIVATSKEGFLPEPVFIQNLAFTADDASIVVGLKKPPTGRFSWQELIQ